MNDRYTKGISELEQLVKIRGIRTGGDIGLAKNVMTTSMATAAVTYELETGVWEDIIYLTSNSVCLQDKCQ